MADSTSHAQQQLQQHYYDEDYDDDATSIASSSATANANATARGMERHNHAQHNTGSQATYPNSTILQDSDNENDAAPGGRNGSTSSLHLHPPSTPATANSARKPSSKGNIADEDQLQQILQRGRGTSFIQQSERPSQASLKDTSVNIATAFRQAATTGSDRANVAAHPSQSISTLKNTTTTVYASTSTSASGIGFLSRAGDREVPLVDTSGEKEGVREYPQQRVNLSTSPLSDGMADSQTHQRPQGPPTSASKKRKSRPSSTSTAKGKTSGTKDSTWKPSKHELANTSDSDEYKSEGARMTDPEDLTKYVENPFGKKVYTVEYEGFGRRYAGKKRLKKRVKGDNDALDDSVIQDDDEDEQEEEEILLDEEDIENDADATASPATRRRNPTSRRGRTPTASSSSASARGKRRSSTTARTRNESVDGSVVSHNDAASQATSQPGSQAVTSYYLHEPSENGNAHANSNGAASSETGPSTLRQPPKPEFQTAEQAGLVQTYPKAGHFQPYFAYSTTTVGASNGAAPLRARRDTTASSSTSGGGEASNHTYGNRTSLLDISGKGGPSSTASFDQRGSDYDYAEEERMTAALLAAKERGLISSSRTGGIPEGRTILPDVLLTRNYGQQAFNRWNAVQKEKERELSNFSGISDLSSEHPTSSSFIPPQQQSSLSGYQQQQQQRNAAGKGQYPPLTSRLGPKRAPPPPPRESSVVPSETTTNTVHPPGNYASIDGSSSTHGDNAEQGEGEESFAQKQAKKSLGRRLGEIVRGFFVLAYWAVAGPVQWLREKDANTLWKSAGAAFLLALVIGEICVRSIALCFPLMFLYPCSRLGSMYEQSPPQHHTSRTSLWDKLPFLPTSSHTNTPFQAPDTLPSNFDEVIQRLVSLEGSFRTLSDTSTKQYTTSTEQSSLLRESAKRLAGLEADFESERRKSNKFHDGIEKSRLQDNDKVDSALKGIKNKLDNLNEVIKSHETERKSDSSNLVRLNNEFEKVHKDLDSYKGRLDMLVSKTDAALDKDRTIKLVRQAIEDILPSRLAVNIDPKTGQVSVDPKFWQYLKSHFSSSSGAEEKEYPTGKGGATVSWEDFIASNSDKLRKIVLHEVDAQITEEVKEGAILSKKTFTQALEPELRSLTQKLSQSTFEQIAHLSHEIDGKLNKLSKGSESSSKHSSIKLSSSGQDVNKLVSALIEEALSKYSKDVLGRPDFALYTAGGRVIPSLTSPSYEIRPSSFSGSILARLTGSGIIRGKAPVTALHPDISTGQCWAINGPSGQLGILLSRRIYPSDITVEHASKDVALDVSSAPRNFEAWGIVSDPTDLQRFSEHSQEQDTNALLEGENKIGNMIRLVKGAYDTEASNNIQTFDVEEGIKRLEIPISALVFKILDNHGNEHLSCLYRVRVGGQVVEEK